MIFLYADPNKTIESLLQAMNKQLAEMQGDIKTIVKGKDKLVSVVRNLFFLFVLLRTVTVCAKVVYISFIIPRRSKSTN